MLASNLLTALDERPFLNRENFPAGEALLGDRAPPMLASFGVDTVHRFLCWEKPEEPGWWDAKCRACAQSTNQRLGLTMLTAKQAPSCTIGECTA